MPDLLPVADADSRIPAEELALRHARARRLMADLAPDAGGLLILGDVNLLHLAGTMAAGVLWLPREGAPILLLRRAAERAREESAVSAAAMFRSFGEIPGLCADMGSPLPADAPILVDMGHVTWSLGSMLASRLKGFSLASGDQVVRRARMVKTPWELARMREAGRRQARCLREFAEADLAVGMEEAEIQRKIHARFLEAGDDGFWRATPPSRAVGGEVAAGESGFRTLAFDAPLGTAGLNPATPCGGGRGIPWKPGQVLAVDMPFAFQGYISDRTQCFRAAAAPVADALRRAHDCCLEIEERTAGMLRPGVAPSEIWDEALRVAESAGLREAFMGMGADRSRFVGHGVGLEADEFPAVAARFDLPLEADTVMALEPKIAVPGVGMTGVEHMFVVTPEGGRCLNGDAADDGAGRAAWGGELIAVARTR